MVADLEYKGKFLRMNGQVKCNIESLFKTFVHLSISFDASTETQYSDASTITISAGKTA